MILADTHAWIWWVSESRNLSTSARSALDSADQVGLSAISCWEIAMLVTKHRLRLDREPLLWLRQSLALPRAQLVAIDPEIAVTAATLDWRHSDPADRLIAATALVHRIVLVTKDQRLRRLGSIDTLW